MDSNRRRIGLFEHRVGISAVTEQSLIQIPPQTFVQQVMPYLVGLVGVLTIAVGAVVKAYADKIIAELKVNRDANAAGTTSTNGKLDKVITQTNGVNEQLQTHIAQQAKVIVALTANQKDPPGEITT